MPYWSESMADPLELAANHAVHELMLGRARMAGYGGAVGLDAKRNAAWCEYGFKEHLEFQDFLNLYRRGGIAHGAVNKLLNTCWETFPWVIEGDEQDNAEGETPWERSVAAEMKRHQIWRHFREADRRRLVGRFSALILRVRDGQDWDKPVTGGKGLAGVIPAWAGSLSVSKWVSDPKAENYGEPEMWQYSEQGVGGQPGRKIPIHPDRVFILGDYSADAVGFLEPAYNAFVSLEKVEGGSGESFLKNAARQIGVNFDKEIDLQGLAATYGVDVDQLQERFNETAREINRGNDAMLITQGATVAPLVAGVSDPRPTYEVNLQTAAAALDIPVKILVGMQTGERASTEDWKQFRSRCQARRQELAVEIESFIARLIKLRVLRPVSEHTALWDDLTVATSGERLADAKLMSEINGQSLMAGAEVFSTDEIREAAGFDPLDAESLPEDEPDGSGADPSNPTD